MSVWSVRGATMSENRVRDQYLLTSDMLKKGVQQGKLRFSWRTCFGRSYRLFVCSELEEYVKAVGPDPVLKKKQDQEMNKWKITEENLNAEHTLMEKRNRLREVKKQLDGMDALKIALTEEKKNLEEWLKENTPPPPPSATKKRKADVDSDKGG